MSGPSAPAKVGEASLTAAPPTSVVKTEPPNRRKGGRANKASKKEVSEEIKAHRKRRDAIKDAKARAKADSCKAVSWLKKKKASAGCEIIAQMVESTVVFFNAAADH